MNFSNPCSTDYNFPPNLKVSENLREVSLIFLKAKKMCFDIDVEKFTLESLRGTLVRISSLLAKPSVVARLPDLGYQLRQAKLKVKKEILFRENLNKTHEKVQKMSLKCASETDVDNAYSVRLCSIERKPTRERFRPNLTRKDLASGHTESMGELRSGAKLIDLSTSLFLQEQQEERTKAQQMKAKQNRLMITLSAKDEEEESSSSDSEYDLNEADEELEAINGVEDEQELQNVIKKYVFNEQDFLNDIDDEQPGPSGVKMIKIALKSEQGKKEVSKESKDIKPLVPEFKGELKEIESLEMPGPSVIKENQIKKEDEDETSSDD